VLAALRADPEDTEDEALNRKIIETALLMAQFEEGTLVLSDMDSIRGRLTAQPRQKEIRPGVQSGCGADRAKAPRSLGERIRVSTGVRAHRAEEGHFEDATPPFVVSEGMDLLVRDGIAGFLTGNTVERLLRRLVCSILVIKPDGFRSEERFVRRYGTLDSSSTASA
jgi:hypothetical protein